MWWKRKTSDIRKEEAMEELKRLIERLGELSVKSYKLVELKETATPMFWIRVDDKYDGYETLFNGTTTQMRAFLLGMLAGQKSALNR